MLSRAKGGPQPMPDEQDARKVLRRHRDDLVRTYGALGAGLGMDGGDYVIVLYLETPRAVPEDASVDGVPLRFVVTGQIETQR
jgi:hypothetical protein